MKKIAAIAAVVTAMTLAAITLTVSDKKTITIDVLGTSETFSDEEIERAVAYLINDVYKPKETDIHVAAIYNGGINYNDSSKYVQINKYKEGEDPKDLSGDYMSLTICAFRDKTPSNVIKAIGRNLFDMNGFNSYFMASVERHDCVVERDKNGEWNFLGDSDTKFDFDYADVMDASRSDIYSTEEREEALEAMTDSDVWNDFDGIPLYAGYAGDESASKEELEKLNKRNGTAYDECMVISADIYSYEKQAVLRDTKWQLAKENGVWRVVEYSASKGENK
ncbi:hypothetical protein [Ruminococcus albus]|uniref:hypothetical protein n=1 Tax=Ruminococcus albus TaxID=1264 RepID=UPI00046308FF|nr:hypothetical protein [Ruminococcus albus]